MSACEAWPDPSVAQAESTCRAAHVRAGLALDIGTREWESEDTIVADAPVVAEPPVVAEAPVVAESFVERRPPTVEIEAEPKPTMQLTAPVMAEDAVEPPPPTVETKLEPKPTVQVAALDPNVRLPDAPHP